MKFITNVNRRVVVGVVLTSIASLFLTACTTYIQPVQPVPGPRPVHAWIPGHYDRFGGWVPGHYR